MFRNLHPTGTNVLWSKNKARNSWWMQTIKVWAAGFLMCLWVVLMKYNRWFKLFQTLISKSLEGLIIHVPGGGRDCKCAFTAPIFYYNLLPLEYLSIPHWMCVCARLHSDLSWIWSERQLLRWSSDILSFNDSVLNTFPLTAIEFDSYLAGGARAGVCLNSKVLNINAQNHHKYDAG